MRKNYEPVAEMASSIYFTVLKLVKLDPMYTFSIDFYVRVFRKSIKQAEKPGGKKILIRVQNII